MFNIGPMEMLVLAAVALIVFGPDKLPQLAKDAARMLRTLRDLAQGARTQLNDELGPGFADLDLRSLNPRTAIKNALLGDDELPTLRPGQFNPREALNRLMDDDAPGAPAGPSLTKPASAAPPPAAGSQPVQQSPSAQPVPRWDSDAT
ncbi:MAG TPA: sec-independent translocase [Jatrophihabitans sp.]|nr:sec-independent translocase [Jatrophihabitans sp.]